MDESQPEQTRLEPKPIPFIIIDDDTEVVESLKALVSKIFPKSEIFEGYNGEEGWFLIKKQKVPTIVLSDIFMPIVNGIQLIKKIRTELNETDGKHPEIYFIALTSVTDKESNLKALQSGANDVLYKPITIDELLGRLRSASQVLSLKVNLKKELERNKTLHEDLD
ncbi:MAG: response regulator, partial [FCB group bacterium]